MTSAPPRITLHPLTIADTASLQVIYEAAGDYFERTAGRQPPAGLAEADLSEAATDPGRNLLGVHLAEKMVGVIDLKLADPGPLDVRIGLILLIPAQRRHGLESWALQILEEWLRQATPSEAVALTVAAQDHAAQAFFRSQGYSFTGQATRLVIGKKRRRLLWMRKTLR